MIKTGILRAINSLGYTITRSDLCFSRQELAAIAKFKEYTATSPERLVGLMDAVSYLAQNRNMIKDKVEETLPGKAPEKIALLRLDTDWYESTAHELPHLYPRLVPGGVLIIDDYGHWQGARQAVDEYFAAQQFRPLLNRMDYSARIMVKSAGR